MTMEDWAKRLDLFLMADDREVLQDAGMRPVRVFVANVNSELVRINDENIYTGTK